MRTFSISLSFSVRALALVGALCWAAPASAQLRIVDYNIAENYNIATDPGGPSGGPGGLYTIFDAIGDKNTVGFAKSIDILAVQEASAGDPALLATKLNAVYGVSTYTAAPYLGSSIGNGLPALVYNSATVTLSPDPLDDNGVEAFGSVGGGVSQQPRSTLRYQLRPVGYDAAAEFFLYNSHYKADTDLDDQAQRFAEAQSIRNNVDALGEGVHAIFAGDFNAYDSTEDGYQELLSAGAGQAFDPVSRPGQWDSSSMANQIAFKRWHTQSPATVSAFSGQVLGGMDNRFDFQLVTGEWLDQEGLSYLSIDPTPETPNGPADPNNTHSYHTFGNNNSHTYNGAITTGNAENADVRESLAESSDHLPVVADYQLPAKMSVDVASIPMNVSQGALVSIDVLIENVASALAAIGADELDYTLSVMGDLTGGDSGTIAALAAGQTKQVTLKTLTEGAKSGTISVTSSSQGAAGALFNMFVEFTVGPGGGGPTRQTIAKDDFDTPLNLVSFDQTPAPNAFSSTEDGFQEYKFGVSATVPADLVDDSIATPSDTRGIINRATKTDAWFGVTDTLNPDNGSGNVSAEWEFNVAGASDLEISIDMGAMGDFETGDFFNWTYSVDGAAFQPLFTSSVDQNASATYELADGDDFVVDDPLSMTTTESQTIELSNLLETLTSPIDESGDLLVIRLDANTNANDAEAYAFDSIEVTGLVGDFDEADFNEDGFVDGDDLLAWETNYGDTGAEKEDGDADLDGDVDGADFLTWQRQITPPAAVVAGAPVPEPTTGALLIAACAAMLGARRRCAALGEREA